MPLLSRTRPKDDVHGIQDARIPAWPRCALPVDGIVERVTAWAADALIDGVRGYLAWRRSTSESRIS